MINFKLPAHKRKPTIVRHKKTQNSAKKNAISNIHKCPVNTLLTSIFSGIAWNG